MARQSITFLDYEIINSGNSDGWVLTKPNGKLYETHLGNYDKLYHAKKSAVIYFMIARPEEFATQIARRAMGGQGTMHEFFKLKRSIEQAGLVMPEEITSGGNSNCLIYYMGEKIDL